ASQCGPIRTHRITPTAPPAVRLHAPMPQPVPAGACADPCSLHNARTAGQHLGHPCVCRLSPLSGNDSAISTLTRGRVTWTEETSTTGRDMADKPLCLIAG